MMMNSSSSPLPNGYPSSLPHGESCSSSTNDRLWDEIDLAERYLVSSQFEEAATLCSTVLQKLRRLVSTSDSRHLVLQRAGDDAESIELDDMMESAGMVLIQAYSETGRSSKIFEMLEPVFGCVAEVPPSIFLAGVCLQISAGFFSDARMVIESFLQNWASTSSDGKLCAFKMAGKQVHGPVCLKLEIYFEIVEIYCIQVLAKGLKRSDLALQWVREADIPEDNKQNLIEKLERIWIIPDTKGGTDLISQCKVTEAMSTTAHSDSWARSLVVEAEQIDENRIKNKVHKDVDSVSSRSVQLFSPVAVFPSRLITALSAEYPLYSLRWHKVLAVVSQKRIVFSGAATFFLIYAIYRQRLNLRRSLKKFVMVLNGLLHAIRVGFADVWQLAFGVQLNPLAAVQPLPSSHYVRR